MDYIETVLRRQALLWSALFHGQTDTEQQEKTQLRSDPFAPGQGGVMPTQEGPRAAAYAAEWETGRAAAERGRGAVSREQIQEASTEALSAALLWRSQRLREAVAGDTGEDRAMQTPSGRRVASRAAGKAEEADWEARPVETDGGDGPRILSRTLEQDARRYDGGFFLY